MKKHLANLAAKSISAGFLAFSLAVPIHAGIPVFDGVNISQSIMTAMENIAQTAKQIEQYEKQVQQYKTQLDQYENMLKNTARPVTEIWDQAQSTMNALRSAVDTLNRYKQQLGSLDAYLSKFQDIDYYKSSPCFTSSGCDNATREALIALQQRAQTESQKKANDALFKGLDLQQEALSKDAKILERLQSAAKGADGQMQALGYANQLASAQANQMLQIRGLLVAQQNSIATRQQALNDREAMKAAGDAKAFGGSYSYGAKKSY